MLLQIVIVICATVVALFAIAGIIDAVEKCSEHKWRSLNSGAFEDTDWEDK